MTFVLELTGSREQPIRRESIEKAARELGLSISVLTTRDARGELVMRYRFPTKNTGKVIQLRGKILIKGWSKTAFTYHLKD